MEEKVFFEDSKGNKICGILANKNQNKRAMILCHGLSSKKENATILQLEKMFNKADITTLRFDFFGHGESEGGFDELTLENFVDDILSAQRFLKKQGHIEFGIYASSFAGPAAVIAENKHQGFRFLTIKSPGYGKSSKENPLLKPDFDKGTWFEAGKKVLVPTLIVHGSADQTVELAQGIKLHKAIKFSQLEVVEGADHAYSKPEDFDKMTKLVFEFAMRHF